MSKTFIKQEEKINFDEETEVSESKKYRPRQRARGNNAKARQNEAYRIKIGKKVEADFRAKQHAKYTSALPSDFSLLTLRTPITFTNRPVNKVVKRIPYSTFGYGLSVSQLYVRFFESFRNANCNLYSVYRLALAQLELQQQMSAKDSTNIFPVDESLVHHVPSDFRDVVKSHPANFKVLVYMVETFGRFKYGEVDCISVIPNKTEKNPYFVTFLRLKKLVKWLSTAGDDQAARRYFIERNPLPGAFYDEETWTLTNPDDFWPEDYSAVDLQHDAVSVLRLLENMKTKFEQVSADVSYSGCGKMSNLISVCNPSAKVPYQVPVEETDVEDEAMDVGVSPKKRKCGKRFCTVTFEPEDVFIKEMDWYSSEPLGEQEAALGMLSFSGITTDDLERDHPVFRVRNIYNSANRVADSWSAIFAEAVPRIART